MIQAEWLELESDPGLFTLLLEDFGVSGVQVEEVYDLSKPITEIVYGFIFLFHWNKKKRPCRRSTRCSTVVLSANSPNISTSATVCDNIRSVSVSRASVNYRQRSAPGPTPENVVESQPLDIANEIKLIGSRVGSDDTNEIFFAQQVVQNSCATHALLSILLNRPEIDIGHMLLEFQKATRHLSPEAKGLAIGSMPQLAQAHNRHAAKHLSTNKNVVQSEILNLPEPSRAAAAAAAIAVANVGSVNSTNVSDLGPTLLASANSSHSVVADTFHFVCYLPIAGYLYELDGLTSEPINHGPLRDLDDKFAWTIQCADVLKERMQEQDVRYNLLAVVPDRRVILNKRMQTLKRNRQLIQEILLRMCQSESVNKSADQLATHLSSATSMTSPVSLTNQETLDTNLIDATDCNRFQNVDSDYTINHHPQYLYLDGHISDNPLFQDSDDQTVINQNDQKSEQKYQSDQNRLIQTRSATRAAGKQGVHSTSVNAEFSKIDFPAIDNHRSGVRQFNHDTGSLSPCNKSRKLTFQSDHSDQLINWQCNDKYPHVSSPSSDGVSMTASLISTLNATVDVPSDCCNPNTSEMKTLSSTAQDMVDTSSVEQQENDRVSLLTKQSIKMEEESEKTQVNPDELSQPMLNVVSVKDEDLLPINLDVHYEPENSLFKTISSLYTPAVSDKVLIVNSASYSCDNVKQSILTNELTRPLTVETQMWCDLLGPNHGMKTLTIDAITDAISTEFVTTIISSTSSKVVTSEVNASESTLESLSCPPTKTTPNLSLTDEHFQLTETVNTSELRPQTRALTRAFQKSLSQKMLMRHFIGTNLFPSLANNFKSSGFDYSIPELTQSSNDPIKPNLCEDYLLCRKSGAVGPLAPVTDCQALTFVHTSKYPTRSSTRMDTIASHNLAHLRANYNSIHLNETSLKSVKSNGLDHSAHCLSSTVSSQSVMDKRKLCGLTNNINTCYSPFTVDELTTLLQRVDEQAKLCDAALLEEEEKRCAYRVDDARRVHNYEPFIRAYLTALSQYGVLHHSESSGPSKQSTLFNLLFTSQNFTSFTTNDVITQKMFNGLKQNINGDAVSGMTKTKGCDNYQVRAKKLLKKRNSFVRKSNSKHMYSYTNGSSIKQPTYRSNPNGRSVLHLTQLTNAITSCRLRFRNKQNQVRSLRSNGGRIFSVTELNSSYASNDDVYITKPSLSCDRDTVSVPSESVKLLRSRRISPHSPLSSSSSASISSSSLSSLVKPNSVTKYSNSKKDTQSDTESVLPDVLSNSGDFCTDNCHKFPSPNGSENHIANQNSTSCPNASRTTSNFYSSSNSSRSINISLRRTNSRSQTSHGYFPSKRSLRPRSHQLMVDDTTERVHIRGELRDGSCGRISLRHRIAKEIPVDHAAVAVTSDRKLDQNMDSPQRTRNRR